MQKVSVRIRSSSGLHLPDIQSECGKIRTRKTSNTDTFRTIPDKSSFFRKSCMMCLIKGVKEISLSFPLNPQPQKQSSSGS